MPTYDYEIVDTGELIEIVHSIHDKAWTEMIHPKTGETCHVKRLVSGGTGTIFKGDGWTINFGNRGYKGKFGKHLRPVGSPVDAPQNKSEADRQFQAWVDSGGLTGIQPTMNFAEGTTPQSTDAMLDQNYRFK